MAKTRAQMEEENRAAAEQMLPLPHDLPAPSVPLMEMPVDEFLGALPEITGGDQEQTDFLMREYNRINSLTGNMDADVGEGRTGIAGNFLSKPEGSTGWDAVRGLRVEPRAGATGVAQGVEQALTATGRAAQGRMPDEDMTMEAFGAASLGAAPGLASAGRGIGRVDENTMNIFGGNRATDPGYTRSGGRAPVSTGADNNFRFEIDDSDFAVVEQNIPRATSKTLGGNPVTLGESIIHDELFYQYPDLENVPIFFDTNLKQNTRGEFQPPTDEFPKGYIALNPDNSPEQNRLTLIHEIQHDVQQREGFAPGSSPIAASQASGTRGREFLAANRDKVIDQLETARHEDFSGSTEGFIQLFNNIPREIAGQNIRRLEEANGLLQSVFNSPLSNANRRSATLLDVQITNRQALEGLAGSVARGDLEFDSSVLGPYEGPFKNMVEGASLKADGLKGEAASISDKAREEFTKIFMGDMPGFIPSETPKMLDLLMADYRTSMGEVESRNTSNRLDLTPEERATRTPESTEDVPREFQWDGSGDSAVSMREIPQELLDHNTQARTRRGLLDRDTVSEADNILYRPDRGYRFIGSGGYADLMDSGIIRAAQGTKKDYGEPYFMTGKSSSRYGQGESGDYMVETPQNSEWNFDTSGAYARPNRQLTINDPIRIFKRNEDGSFEVVYDNIGDQALLPSATRQGFAEGGLDSNLLPASASVSQSNLDAWSEGAYFKDPETGQPQQMYHGMGGTLRGEPIEFLGDNLEPSYAGTLGPGTYITNDPSVASNFATGKRGASYTDEKFGGQVFPVYTNVTNVVDDAVINSNRELREELADRIIDIADENGDQYLYDLVDKLKADGDIKLGSLYTRVEDGKVRSSGVGSLVSEVFETNGYDAVSTVTDKGFHEAVIFQGHGGLEYPNQNIKSTLQGPDGAYSRETNDMRFAEGGLVAEVSNNAMADYFKAASGMMSEEEFTGKHKMSTRAFENKFEEQNNVDISGAESFTEITGTSKGDNMRKQMSFFNEGGIAAPRRDPVSGNEIPLGSSAENVRDDVPAMLSEGEYIVPADVVRFFGVNFFEQLRDKAKGGMQEMVADDRVGGNNPQQENMQVDPEMVQAVTQMAEGGLIDSGNINQLIDKVVESAKTNPELQGIFQKRGIMMAAGGLVTGEQAPMAGVPQGTFNPNDWSTVGGSYMGAPGSSGNSQGNGGFTYVPYTNANGTTMQILFINGKPAQTIPEGFTAAGEAPIGSSAGGTTSGITSPATQRNNDGDRHSNAAADYARTSSGTGGGDLPDFSYGDPLSEVDFSDPAAVMQWANDRLTTDENPLGSFASGAAGFLGGAIGGPLGGALGKIASSGYGKIRDVAVLNAAALQMEAQGDAATAKALRQLASDATDAFKLSGMVPEGMMDGSAIYERYSGQEDDTTRAAFGTNSSGYTATGSSGAGIEAAKFMTQNDRDAGQTYADTGGDRADTWTGGQVATNQNYSHGSNNDGTSNNDAQDAQDARNRAQDAADRGGYDLATGGRYKGGLVTRPKK